VSPAHAGADAGSPARRLDQLTSLRFFAALAVLASHLWILAEEPNPLQPLARGLFAEGFAGVSFFFVLSGYILSHSYGARLRDGRVSRGEYWALRVARIGPLHWLTALPFALAALIGAGWASLPISLANLAMVQSWVPLEHWYFSLNEPSWSLADELFFYTVFAWAAGWSTRVLGWVMGLCLLMAIAVAGWLVMHGQGAIRHGEAMTPTHWLTYINPLTRLLDFLAGMLAWRLPPPRWRGGLATLVEVGACALVVGAAALLPTLGVADSWRMQLAYLPGMLLLVWVFGGGRGTLSRWLAKSAALVLLGEASFALYLVHLPVIHGFLALDDAREVPWPVLPLAAAMAASAIALSLAVHLGVERPLLARLRPAIARRFRAG
jgi:peptidoglycan/LPS O-acetylase OafA/YrhL